MSINADPALQSAGAVHHEIVYSKRPLRVEIRPRIGRVPKVAARRADGTLVCLSDLPDPNLRWTRLRKEAVVECVEFGLISEEAVRRRYGLSEGELDEWRHAWQCRGRRPLIWRERPRHVTEGVLERGSLEVDLDRKQVRVRGEVVELAPLEWRILAVLAEADGAVVTSAMLMGALYENAENAAGPKIADVLMCRLRRKLGREGRRIRSVWGRGFHLSD